MSSNLQSSKPGRRRVFFVDDHPLVREWLSSLLALESDLELVGQAEEMNAALSGIAQTKPEVIVVDLSLPRGSGLEMIKTIHAQHPGIRMLVLSMHDDASVAERAFRAGAHGYVMKREPGPSIIAGIRAVLAGKFFASPTLASQLAGRMFGAGANSGGAPEDLLSDRELEVFRLRGKGLGSKEIAAQLNVSAKTVGSYEARIKEKLGLSDGGALVREAVLWHAKQSGL